MRDQSIDSEISTTNKIENKNSRLFSIDAVRGLIMILMALDHASFFIANLHSSGEYWGGPLLPVYQDPLTFLTRFVSHFAAPGFFLLMGIGMALFTSSRQNQGWSKFAIIKHFILRGSILVLLQFLVINPAWTTRLDFIYIGVLFALGGTMIISSLFLWIKPKHLIIVTIALVLTMTAQIQILVGTDWADFSWSTSGLLFVYPGSPMNGSISSNYPILPWLSVVIFGIVFGKWILENKKNAFDRSLKLGIVFFLAFFIIRSLVWKNDALAFFAIRSPPINNWMDFFSLVKYPPSILFLLITLGVLLILLGLFSRVKLETKKLFKPLLVFGRVPLFFYVMHFFVYKGMGWILYPKINDLWTMYPFWILGLIILYPLCIWYNNVKHRHAKNIFSLL